MTVYNMPIWLRKFTFNEIKKIIESKNKSHSNNNSSVNVTNPDGSINKNNFAKVFNKTKGKINHN